MDLFILKQTPSIIEQLLGCKILTEKPFIIDDFTQLNKTWNSGTAYPSQGKKIVNKLCTDSDKYIAIIEQNTLLAEQNTLLVEHNKQLIDDKVDYLTKQNQHLTEEIKHLKETAPVQNITNKTINKTFNKAFNMNFFLNEECKNAVTLVDFVTSLKIEDSDLFYAKDNGLANALTHIFERGLEQYAINDRPVHCTDAKREVIHIKDSNGWIKENGSDSIQLRRAINRLSYKNIDQLAKYIALRPEFKDANAPDNENHLKLMMAVYGDYDLTNTENKVIKNIAKTVFVNKTTV